MALGYLWSLFGCSKCLMISIYIAGSSFLAVKDINKSMTHQLLNLKIRILAVLPYKLYVILIFFTFSLIWTHHKSWALNLNQCLGGLP